MKCSLSFPAVKKKHAHGALLQSYDNWADTTLFVVVIITAFEITAGRSAFTERQELELERQNAIFTVHFDRRFYRLGSSINYIRTVFTDPV